MTDRSRSAGAAVGAALRFLALTGIGILAAWAGAAGPVAVFVLTGLPPVVASVLAMLLCVAAGLVGGRRSRVWRAPVVAIASGGFVGGLFTAAFSAMGGWSFGE